MLPVERTELTCHKLGSQVCLKKKESHPSLHAYLQFIFKPGVSCTCCLQFNLSTGFRKFSGFQLLKAIFLAEITCVEKLKLMELG